MSAIDYTHCIVKAIVCLENVNHISEEVVTEGCRQAFGMYMYQSRKIIFISRSVKRH
jgi:hypothetical protein